MLVNVIRQIYGWETKINNSSPRFVEMLDLVRFSYRALC